MKTACGPRARRIVGPARLTDGCAPPLSTASSLSTYTHDPSSDVVANVYASSRGATIQPDQAALNPCAAPPAAESSAPVDGVSSSSVLAGSPLQSMLAKYCARRPSGSGSKRRATTSSAAAA